MTEPADEFLRWVIPAAVVFGVTALAVIAGLLALRRARRSPKARAAAEAAQNEAGRALVRLDDAVDDLDVEVSLSGALYGGDAPTALRRARMTAQHVRDDGFEEYRRLADRLAGGEEAARVRRSAEAITRRVDAALRTVEVARTAHAAWVTSHVSAAEQVRAAQARLAEVRAAMGDPEALIAQLARFDEREWQDAAAAARAAVTEADEAEERLAEASRSAADPSRNALADLAAGERALRRAEADARTLEETYRLITQASQALPDEFDSARGALRAATATRAKLEPAHAERLGEEIRAVASSLDALESGAARRPTQTIGEIARLRDRLDAALGDARTAQQRLRGARTALPGTLAAARNGVALAEAAMSGVRPGADARARLISAQRDLAAARQAQDPVEALDAARRALRHAEDAQALARYAADEGGAGDPV
ncbi:hypothetical protein [Microbacterium invictum]|uniref:Chromosome partition protein Smc n=1 Tax=Microbacterium invictum TaxID=515415 RepID=A0ABZ0VBB6_9MICO|nr:hypothetical protein [Microbacterium invictum]WQB70414.1 hypothetical protein T9R20_00195 [Microbacterium invictum]